KILELSTRASTLPLVNSVNSVATSVLLSYAALVRAWNSPTASAIGLVKSVVSAVAMIFSFNSVTVGFGSVAFAGAAAAAALATRLARFALADTAPAAGFGTGC